MRGLPVSLLLLGLASCDASGDVSGGDYRYDASAPTVNESTYADADPGTWTGIYRDFFGRHAVSGCAGNGQCHDVAGKPGYIASNFVCTDKDTCYTALRNAHPPDPSVGTRALVDDVDLAMPSNAYLFSVFRYRGADGNVVAPDPANNMPHDMPQEPTDFIFSADDIARIQTWIQAGAPNN